MHLLTAAVPSVRISCSSPLKQKQKAQRRRIAHKPVASVCVCERAPVLWKAGAHEYFMKRGAFQRRAAAVLNASREAPPPPRLTRRVAAPA